MSNSKTAKRRRKPSRRSASEEVVAFWRAAEKYWFAKSRTFDAKFRERFLDLHLEVAARRHDRWLKTPNGALALLILTDQFPRNAFRGTAHMYATDPLARHYARQALALGYFDRVEAPLRSFLCLPLSHSEDSADQDLACELNTKLGKPWLDHAEVHREVIRQFGRFPHRNPILGRTSTRAEEEFLAAGGFGG